MNIMFLIFSFNTGGIERLLIDLCNGMASRGNHVWLTVINQDYEPSLLACLNPSVCVIRLDRPASSGRLHYMRELSRLIGRNHIQILHCQGMNCVLFSLLAKLQHPDLVVINTVHDSGNYPSYSDGKIFLSNRILSMTIAISDSVRKEILARKVDPQKVITVYNAIDTSKFQYFTQTSVSSETSICARGFRLINVARFFPAKKGQDTLIHAVMELLPRYPGLVCVFAGAVFKGQQEKFQTLTQEISSVNASDHFRFLGNVSDVPGVLRKADLFILPSNYEGFGISLIEAMAMGLPCIASDLEGPAEIFRLAQQDQVNVGCLFMPGNSHDLAQKIEYCMKYYGSFDHKAIADFAARHFDITSCVERHLRLYQDLCHK